MRPQAALAAFTLLFACHAAAQLRSPCQGERVSVVPFMPVATSPGVARAEEERLREELAASGGHCVQARADTLRLLEGKSALACGDASCRQQLAQRLDAQWVISGMVFGFGGRTSLTLTAWDATGERLGRRTFSAESAGSAQALLAGARALPQGGVPREAPVRGRAVPLALGGTGLLALAAGAAFGVASLETARGITEARTGCAGTGAVYIACLDERSRLGRRQASTANWLLGAGAVLGVTAGVFWVVRWP